MMIDGTAYPIYILVAIHKGEIVILCNPCERDRC